MYPTSPAPALNPSKEKYRSIHNLQSLDATQLVNALEHNGTRKQPGEVVAATQGADDATQETTSKEPERAFGFFGAQRPFAPRTTFIDGDDIVPASQDDEDGYETRRALLTPPRPSGDSSSSDDDTAPLPSPKALGKRRAIPEDVCPSHRVKRRFIATSDSEDDAFSDSDDDQVALDDLSAPAARLSAAILHEATSRLWLSTGDRRLDQMLGGGLRRGTVTEIVGESSAGKSQLALQIAMHAVLGLGSDSSERYDRSRRPNGVAILTPQGEATASSLINRMVELAKAVPQRIIGSDASGSRRGAQEVDAHVKTVLRNVHVACLQDADALDHALAYTLPGLQQRLRSQQSRDIGPVNLVIIESLPAFLQDNTVDMNQFAGRAARARLLCSIADRLRCLCFDSSRHSASPTSSGTGAAQPIEDFGPAILIINHVSDAFERETAIARAMLQDGHIPVHELPLETIAAENRHVLPSTLVIAADAALEPPLAFDLQSVHSSGLLATIPTSISAAGVRAQRDASGQELPADMDDFARALKGRLKLAQLGNVWTNCIGARLMLSRTSRRVPASIVPDYAQWAAESGGSGSKTKARLRVLPVRHASLAFSSHSPSGVGSDSQSDFVITSGRGFHAIPGEQDLDRISLTQVQQRRERKQAQDGDHAGARAGDASRAEFEDIFADLDDDAEDELERLAFDVEIDAALASIPEDASSSQEDGSGAVLSSSASLPSQPFQSSSSQSPTQQGGVVPASSLPLPSSTKASGSASDADEDRSAAGDASRSA
ncbi:hypothetical protein OC834_005059 [Tilletia horrida]|nr:hypothetical protein OC834_005059 [Tilletia horrida]